LSDPASDPNKPTVATSNGITQYQAAHAQFAAIAEDLGVEHDLDESLMG